MRTVNSPRAQSSRIPVIIGNAVCSLVSVIPAALIPRVAIRNASSQSSRGSVQKMRWSCSSRQGAKMPP